MTGEREKNLSLSFSSFLPSFCFTRILLLPLLSVLFSCNCILSLLLLFICKSFLLSTCHLFSLFLLLLSPFSPHHLPLSCWLTATSKESYSYTEIFCVIYAKNDEKEEKREEEEWKSEEKNEWKNRGKIEWVKRGKIEWRKEEDEGGKKQGAEKGKEMKWMKEMTVQTYLSLSSSHPFSLTLFLFLFPSLLTHSLVSWFMHLVTYFYFIVV